LFTFWFGFKSTRQDGKETEIQNFLEFIINKAIEEVKNISIKLSDYAINFCLKK
jgi:hypothetical protein